MKKPFDWHCSLVMLQRILPFLRVRRKRPELTLQELIREAEESGRRVAEAEGLYFAGRFIEGDEIVVQWRDRHTARFLLGFPRWVIEEWRRWYRLRKERRVEADDGEGDCWYEADTLSEVPRCADEGDVGVPYGGECETFE